MARSPVFLQSRLQGFLSIPGCPLKVAHVHIPGYCRVYILLRDPATHEVVGTGGSRGLWKWAESHRSAITHDDAVEVDRTPSHHLGKNDRPPYCYFCQFRPKVLMV